MRWRPRRSRSARGARVVHPRGQASAGTVEIDGSGAWGARLLDDAGRHDVVVRVSRGAGLPRPLPDVVGLAIRFPGLGRAGGDRSDRRILLGARRSGPGASWELLAATLAGDWSRWGRLTLGAPLGAAASDTLRFRPTLGADDLEPVELFRALRERSYVESQSLRR